METTSQSVAATMRLGRVLAGSVRKGDIICISGCLGAGKTVFVKGIAKGLGVLPDEIISPTFVLLREHRGGRLPLYHFDLYRLSSVAEISALGYEEFLWSDGVTVVEWPERLHCLLPRERLAVSLVITGTRSRRIHLTAHGQRYQHLLKGRR